MRSAHRFGIAARLTGGLGLLLCAAMAIAVVSLLAVRTLSERVAVLSEDQLPLLLVAGNLERESGQLAGLARSLAGSTSEFERLGTIDEMSERIDAVNRWTDVLMEFDEPTADVAGFVDHRDRFFDVLDRLNAAVVHRLAIERRLVGIRQDLDELRQQLNAEQTRLEAIEIGNAEPEPVWSLLMAINQNLEALNAIITAVGATSAIEIDDAIADLADRRRTLIDVGLPPVLNSNEIITQSRERLIATIGASDGVIFRLREYAAARRNVDGVLAESRGLARDYLNDTSNVVNLTSDLMQASRRDAELAFVQVFWVIVVGGVVGTIATGIVFFYVRNSVLRRLRYLRASMGDMAKGRIVDIAVEGSDEVADMVQTFRYMAEESTRREENWRQSEARLRLIVEASPFPIVITSADDARILYGNQAARTLAEVDPDDNLVGHAAEAFYVNKEERAALLATVSEERPIHGREIQLVTAKGRPIWVLMSAVPLVFDGKPALYAALNDITDRKRRETELREARDELARRTADLAGIAESLELARRDAESARVVAEQANRAKSEFLAMMSHELRTPLNAVLGFSEMIRDQAFGPIGNERYAAYARDIFESGSHLLDLINDILDISKIETGHRDLMFSRISADDIFSKARRLVSERIERHGLFLDTDIAADTPPLHVDVRAVKQIIFNLLSNAVKFTPEGGRITLGARPGTRDEVILSVEDTGCGIPADKIDKVVLPFFQVDNTYARSSGGTGLGLSLVKSLTELHGGSLKINSEEDVGTRVEVILPAFDGAKGERPPIAAAG